MSLKKLIAAVVALGLLGVATVAAVVLTMAANLPQMITLQDYKPLVVSSVFDRNGKKVGEFYREDRILTPYNKIPEHTVHAFVAAEDDSFFHHHGVNYVAMFRAFLANLRAGRKAQGASTITQQVARSLLLTSAKTYTRKIKEILLAQRMEDHLSKQDILYLYLNQIYLGEGAYGVGAAAQIYFHKNVADLTIPESAILAGLPQAPSRYSPTNNPKAAKDRQRYVLNRMAAVGYLTKEDAQKYANEPVKIYFQNKYKDFAPYYMETLREALVKDIGEETLLDKGVKIYTGLDLDKQEAAEKKVDDGLRELDKREGYRGAKGNLSDPNQVAEFLLKTRNELINEATPVRVLRPDGTFETHGPLNLTGKTKDGQPMPVLPDYVPIGKIVKGIVTKVDDDMGLTYVRFAESKGLIDMDSMKWARKPNIRLHSYEDQIDKPSQALKVGDIIEVKVIGAEFKSDRLQKMIAEHKKKPHRRGHPLAPLPLPSFKDYVLLNLEQEPQAQAALLAIDEKTSDVISLVGGYDFDKSQFNRALQAARQTGSAFKAFVYASALDKGYTPATPIMDAPVIYEEHIDEGQDQPEVTKLWKPKNDENHFGGDILFRNAIIRSLNVPTIKILQHIGIDWAATYARRLGIFSPLNMDYTLGLGTSGITLYEMTRAFGILGRMGKALSPILVHKVVDHEGKTIAQDITVDERFDDEEKPFKEDFEKKREAYLADPTAHKSDPPIYFQDPDQLIRPETAYVITSILQGVIDEPGGTGGAARSLGRPAAGKTGSTNGYYDAWFIGYTPDIVAGVWVGYDQEKSLGRGEVGAHAALPIWLSYMKTAHDGLPARSFPVPDNIVFANIDNQTGKLVSPSSKVVVRQAFIDGTEPGANSSNQNSPSDDKNFFKEDLSE